MKTYTYSEISNDWNLWCDYVDPDASMTEDEFDAMTVEERIQMMIEMFGEEDDEDIYNDEYIS